MPPGTAQDPLENSEPPKKARSMSRGKSRDGIKEKKGTLVLIKFGATQNQRAYKSFHSIFNINVYSLKQSLLNGVCGIYMYLKQSLLNGVYGIYMYLKQSLLNGVYGIYMYLKHILFSTSLYTHGLSATL